MFDLQELTSEFSMSLCTRASQSFLTLLDWGGGGADVFRKAVRAESGILVWTNLLKPLVFKTNMIHTHSRRIVYLLNIEVKLLPSFWSFQVTKCLDHQNQNVINLI